MTDPRHALTLPALYSSIGEMSAVAYYLKTSFKEIGAGGAAFTAAMYWLITGKTGL